MTKNKTSFQAGNKHPNWKGGSYIDSDGYRRILINGKYIKEHIYVAEQKIGRKLKKEEVVHHKDENRSNNTPSNLEVMTRSQHGKLHNLNKKHSEETKKKYREIRKGTNQKEKHTQWKTYVTKEKIEELLKTKLKLKEIANQLNIHPDSLRNRMKYYGLSKRRKLCP